jgi:tripartite-type tricarboxylate transporter receptor subunit TctC
MIRAFRTCAICLAGVIAGASPPAALAQNAYPAKPIRIVVPLGPGGSGDVIARILAIPLQQALGQGIIVENRGGAGSNIGTVAVARAEPDGYTLLLTTSAFVANPGLYRSISYDPFRDFAPVADLAVSPNVLVANPRSGIHSIAELIAMARAHPDQINYSSGGIGTTANLAVEMLKVRAGINLTHISYPGGGPATQAVLAGTVQVAALSMPNVHELARAGTVRPLAITGATRWGDLAEVPTLIEAGFPDVVSETAHLLLAPAATPPDIVARLARETIAILERRDMREKLTRVGFSTVAGGPDALKARIAREVPYYKALAVQANIHLD